MVHVEMGKMALSGVVKALLRWEFAYRRHAPAGQCRCDDMSAGIAGAGRMCMRLSCIAHRDNLLAGAGNTSV